GLWAIYDWRRRITARLGATARVDPTVDTGIAGEASGSAWVTWKAILRRTAVCARLAVMAEQAGYRDAGAEWLTMIVAAGLVGAVVASLRTGSMLMAAATALVFGTFPVGYLFYQRHQRLVRFEQQLPDALGMMTRALRAGSALSGAIQLVGEEMPAPVGIEFTRVFDEVRLGLDPGEALVRLKQ